MESVRPQLLLLITLAGPAAGICVAGHRRDFSTETLGKLRADDADAFRFGRFQSIEAVKRAFNDVRSTTSFRPHKGKDGRRGAYCSTKLSGDWVLAESEQYCSALSEQFCSGLTATTASLHVHSAWFGPNSRRPRQRRERRGPPR